MQFLEDERERLLKRKVIELECCKPSGKIEM
jgi:hypothetical protein